MNHANNSHSSLDLDHDHTPDRRSRDSQPPIGANNNDMSSTRNWLDRDNQVHLAKQYRQFVATAPSTAIAVLAGAPFENVKTRMQSKHFGSIPQAFGYTYRTEGLRGFWAGTWPPLISITGNRIASFLVYRKAKYAIDDHVIKPLWGDSSIKYSNDFTRYPNIWTNLTYVPAGMLSGAATTVFLTPVELIKNAAQTSVLMSNQNKSEAEIKRAEKRVGSWGAARQIVKNRGAFALWTGFRLHLVRDVIGSGVYFGAYEILKQSFGTFFQVQDPNKSWVPAMSGGIAGLVGWTLTYPLDTSKTRAQNNLLGSCQTAAPGASQMLAQASKSAARAAANSSRWHGVEMIIVRSFIQNMIQMTGFERIKIMVDNLEFKNGSRTLPGIERERGKDTRVSGNGPGKY